MPVKSIILLNGRHILLQKACYVHQNKLYYQYRNKRCFGYIKGDYYETISEKSNLVSGYVHQ